MKDKKIGFAVTGSFCTFDKAIEEMEKLAENNDVVPILSYNAATLDTRFFAAKDFKDKAEAVTGNKAIVSIDGAEPIGPKKLLDIMVIAPCTGNTLAKLANAITDTPVLMAAKAHLRNERPLVVGVSSNDSLSQSAKNIGMLLNMKNIYFVPMSQDDSAKKPRSVVADFSQVEVTLDSAICGVQLQPIFIG